eukprot:9045533-Prorocentrum_lima.AAC.1
MTSSLVGSEMCIRDRPNPGVPIRPRAGPEARRHLGSPRCAQFRWRAPPVSYTHLTLPTICSV